MEAPRKLIQMAMSRGMHFRRVGTFRSTARASIWHENASWAEIPLLSSQVTEYSMPNDGVASAGMSLSHKAFLQSAFQNLHLTIHRGWTWHSGGYDRSMQGIMHWRCYFHALTLSQTKCWFSLRFYWLPRSGSVWLHTTLP